MSLALIKTVDLGLWLCVPVVPCESCGLSLPVDHHCPATTTAPEGPGAAAHNDSEGHRHD